MRYIKLLILMVAVVSAASCKTQYEIILNSNDVDAKYDAAFDYFNNGKYNKAVALFESLSVLTNGTERDDTVQYYWGLSNYKYKDYYTAETNFSKFVENYPRSPFAPDARYLRIDCLYRQTLRYELDQTPTRKAIAEIEQFEREFPQSEHQEVCAKMKKELNDRLDTKAFESARLYYHMEDYLASRVALRNVLKDNSENIHRENILYHIGMSSYKYAYNSYPAKRRERYLVFIDDYLNFVGEYPDSKYRKELETLYKRAQNAIGRDVSVEEKETSEKDFKRERKKLEKNK